MKVRHSIRSLIQSFRSRAWAPVLPVLAGSALLGLSVSAQAGSAITPAAPDTGSDTRYGLFGLLDHRSGYGQGVFPEPFLNDDSDLEQNEFRFDWQHTSAGSTHSNLFRAEYEKGVGPATFEIAVPYERNFEDGKITEGVGNIEVGARVPVWQVVSPSGFFDNTVGVGIELGIPSHSSVSHTTELVPKMFDDLKIGNFTIQTIIGYSMLLGATTLEGGTHTFEYGATLGYTISHKVLPIPGVQQLIPVFEVSGETQLNKDAPGQNSLLSFAGFRVNTKAIGRVQPRLGFGVVLPLDNGGHADTHWGLITSLVFEY